MLKDRFLKRIFLIGFVMVIALPMMLEGLAVINPYDPVGTFTGKADKNTPVLTSQRQQHLLYGDRSGGGHLYGTGKPCKSEFPRDWDAEKIVHTVTTAAANDNLRWQQQDNGYYVADTQSGNLSIRIVLNENKREIVTAYPTNVPRNPCPARNRTPANDN